MSDMSQDLEGNYPVQESRVIIHPQYCKPVLLTRYGWAKRKGFFGREVHWYEQKIEQINDGKNT